MVMQEPIAYFTAALCLLRHRPRARRRRRRWNIAAAVALAVVAPFVRDELIVVPAIMVAALGLQYVCFGGGRDLPRERASNAPPRRARRRRRRRCSLLCLVVARAGAVAGRGRVPHRRARCSTRRCGRGARLIVGLGVLPVVIGLAMVVPAAGDQAHPRARRLHVGPRRLARDPHGLRRRQGRLPGGHVRGARRGAEPPLHRAAAVRSRSRSSPPPGRFASGRSRWRRR